MSDNKTMPTESSVMEFLDAIDDEQKRADSFALVELMEEISGEEPRMWGTSIVGFGQYHYRYDSGREGESMMVGFSPRKQALTLYIHVGDDMANLLAKLGKYKTGKGCLYLKNLKDVDLATLKEMVRVTLEDKRTRYPSA